MSTPTVDPQLGTANPGTELQSLMAQGPLPSPTERSEVGTQRGDESGTRVRSLSVVIPAKNEELGLPGLLDELNAVLEDYPRLRREVLVIDDGSTDGTAELARARGARVVSHPESLGNGAAVKRGIREAKMEWVLLLDGDGQHPPGHVPDMLRQAERYDMVIGSRGGSGGAAHRNLANRIYNGLASYVTSRRIPDLTSGFRLMRADVVKGFCYLLPNTFSYPTTITLAMLRCGYSVAFEPIDVRARQGKSHIRLLKDGSRFLIIIMRIATFFAPLRVFMPISLAMFALGLAWYVASWGDAGPRFTNGSMLLFTTSLVIFGLGLVSEQVAGLRFQHTSGDHQNRP